MLQRRVGALLATLCVGGCAARVTADGAGFDATVDEGGFDAPIVEADSPPVDGPTPVDTPIDGGECSPPMFIEYRVGAEPRVYCMSFLLNPFFQLNYLDAYSCMPVSQFVTGEAAGGLSGSVGGNLAPFARAGRVTSGIVLRNGGPRFSQLPGLAAEDCRTPGSDCAFLSRECSFDVLQGASAMGEIGEVRLAAPCVLHAEPALSSTQITVTNVYFRLPLQLRFQETSFGTLCPNDR